MIVKGGKTFNRKINNILVIQLGDIGDVVWSPPAFRAVKDTYPHADVSLKGSSRLREMGTFGEKKLQALFDTPLKAVCNYVNIV